MPVNETVERIVYEGVDRISTVSKKSADSVRTLRQGLDAVKGALAAVGVTVGAGAMVTLYMETLKAVAALDDMAESTGASVEKLSAIQRVAKVGGHDFEGLTGQIAKMVKGLREGTDEGGRTASALAFLDIKAKDTNGRFRDTGEILLDVARKLGQYEDGGNKVALVQDILGKGAERYLPLLKEMAEGTDLHSTVTAKQAQEAEEAEKNIRRLTLAFEDSRRELVSEYTPAFTEFLAKLIEARRAAGNVIAGGAMMLFTDTDNISAELGRARKELAELEKPAERSMLGGFVREQAISGARMQIDFLERLQQRRDRDVARRGATDPSSPFFEFAGQPLAYESRDEGKDRKEREFIARQQEEGLEEERRTQAEAAALADAFRAREREQLRKFRALDLQETDDYYQTGGAMLIAAHEDRVRQLMEQADREQDLAIEQGQQTSEAIDEARRREKEIAQQVLGKTFANEGELEEFRLFHQRRLEILQDALDQGVITESAYNTQREVLEQDHQEAMYAVEDAAIRRRFEIQKVHRQLDLGGARTFFGSMSSLMNTQSRKMFEVGKAAAIGGAIIDTYKAATGAYAALSNIPIVGPALGAAAAAAAILAGMANVQAIRAQQFGGGSAATPTFPASPITGLPVGSPTPDAAAQTGESGPHTTLILRGEFFTRESVERLVDLINDNTSRGGRVTIK